MSNWAIVGTVIYLSIGVLLASVGAGYSVGGLWAQVKGMTDRQIVAVVTTSFVILFQFVVVSLFYPLVIAFRLGQSARDKQWKKELGQ